METKAFNTRFTLSSEVEKLSKRQLLNDLNLTTNNRKEVYVSAVTKYVLENVETILSHLMIKDVELVNDFLNSTPCWALLGHSVDEVTGPRLNRK